MFESTIAPEKLKPNIAQEHLPGLRKEKEEIEHFDLEMGPGSRGKLQEGHYQNQKKKLTKRSHDSSGQME